MLFPWEQHTVYLYRCDGAVGALNQQKRVVASTKGACACYDFFFMRCFIQM